VHVRVGNESGLDIRDEIQTEGLKSEVDSRPLNIYLVAPLSNIDVALGDTAVEVVFRTNHLSSDGISIRLVVGDILRMLSSSEDAKDVTWGDENKNLAPSLLSVLGDNQALNGDEFESSSVSYMGSVSRIMVCNTSHASIYRLKNL
jgi:15-O-acetyltransferase Tri3